ncbi:uncharacterized protein [Blastocystis hominis]|uniref:phosphogluconate dehydrogenase (NADP(+)-dependent, decarboxylating) n=1 Tax=Blastocystis hominis TaxID=12968 RepID=D8M4K6_BLAHO|nr:uncharacterized protein [Blastocystis hominis]CBK22995.2 unnamed protein product [Blastocystis hominis]|eukprot:XP_012897043.1 uncharacterized protein [Blastocystis hominis]
MLERNRSISHLEMSSDIGIYGLTSQGISFALNIASKGYNVTVGNKSSDKIKECIELAEKEDLEEKVRGIKDPEDFVKNLKTPRKVLFLARPGSNIDRNMQKVLPFLESGDVIIDGSCDNVDECLRRSAEAQEKGVELLSLAILGTDSDARQGPALLCSGSKSLYDAIEPLLNKVACEVDHRPCLAHVGTAAAAVAAKHAVAALETAELQLLAEMVDVMKQGKLNLTEIASILGDWDKQDGSFLLQSLTAVLKKKDCDVEGCKPSDNSLVDRISDFPPNPKNTADLTALAADIQASMSIPAGAWEARNASSERETRVKLSRQISAPKFDWSKVDLQEISRDLHDAHDCARDILCAQVFGALVAIAKTREWELHLPELAGVLRGGCEIRCDRMEKWVLFWQE